MRGNYSEGYMLITGVMSDETVKRIHKITEGTNTEISIQPPAHQNVTQINITVDRAGREDGYNTVDNIVDIIKEDEGVEGLYVDMINWVQGDDSYYREEKRKGDQTWQQ